jgi:hypothetical protein
VCREDWIIQILHGIQPLCFITRFGEGIVYAGCFVDLRAIGWQLLPCYPAVGGNQYQENFAEALLVRQPFS